MPRTTTLLIAFLAVITAILVIFAISNSQIANKQTVSNVTPTPTVKIVPKTTNIIFLPTKADASNGVPISVDVLADTQSDSISGVQLELQYDPKLLTNVKISSPDNSLFGISGSYAVLFSEVNPTLGRISYAAAIKPTQNSVKGIGKIATITFQKAAQATASPQTTINFIDKTMVTKLGETQTVLNQTSPLTIQLIASPTTITTTPLPIATTSPQTTIITPAQ